jgi:protocatechuate 3,4-dioxygenase beta subunit
VVVESEHFAGANIWGFHDLKTTTDAQGRFRLAGMPKGRGNQIIAIPNDDQPFFMQQVDVPDSPGLAPVSLEIALHPGIWIEGRITEKETGQPVPKAWVFYMPFLDNPFAQATPEFGKDGNVPAGFAVQDRYQTRADGSYRTVGLPGRAIVGVQAHNKAYRQAAGSESIKGMDRHGQFPTYHNPVPPSRFFPTAMKEINPNVGTESLHLDFALDFGATVRLRVVDPQGRPVAGLKLAGRAQRGRHEWDVKLPAEFSVVNLGPDEDRMVMARNEERKLGKLVHVRAGDDTKGPVVVALEPLATIVGRVADAEGHPVPAATIRTDPLPSGSFMLSLGQEVATGQDGKFLIPNVPAGCNYQLIVESEMLTPKKQRVAFYNPAKVRPGETTDVGEIRFKRD